MNALRDKSLFRQQGLIDGHWWDAASGKTVAVIDPATGTPLGSVPDMGTAETRGAIAAAQAASGPWRQMTHAERAALLEAWHDLIIDKIDELALLLTRE